MIYLGLSIIGLIVICQSVNQNIILCLSCISFRIGHRMLKILRLCDIPRTTRSSESLLIMVLVHCNQRIWYRKLDYQRLSAVSVCERKDGLPIVHLFCCWYFRWWDGWLLLSLSRICMKAYSFCSCEILRTTDRVGISRSPFSSMLRRCLQILADSVDSWFHSLFFFVFLRVIWVLTASEVII